MMDFLSNYIDYLVNLILGSTTARSISDKNVPITVIVPSINTIAADTKRSSLKRAFSSNGPSVGRFKTTDTIMLPEIR